jgi:hypothetical protein
MMNETISKSDYKVIPTNFTKKGFTYEQVKREGNRAIFKQTRKGTELCNFEVVRLGKHNGYTMGGVYIEPSETYPGSSLWGIMGWTCTSLEDALRRYEVLQ